MRLYVLQSTQKAKGKALVVLTGPSMRSAAASWYSHLGVDQWPILPLACLVRSMGVLGEDSVQMAPFATQIPGVERPGEPCWTIPIIIYSQLPATLGPMCLPPFQGECFPRHPFVCTVLAASVEWGL